MASEHPDPAERLSQWMARAKIPSVRSLSRQSGVSRRQIEKLQSGDVHLIAVGHALQLAQTLNISLSELLQLEHQPVNQQAVQAEYERLKSEMAELRSQAFQSFQTETLNILEPLLLQWPTAAYAAQKNPTAPAVRLLPLLNPLERLLQHWQIEAIGIVGEVVPYAPQRHQWAGDSAPSAVDSPVQISHVGYQQADKLLYRAKVHLPDSEKL